MHNNVKYHRTEIQLKIKNLEFFHTENSMLYSICYIIMIVLTN